MNEDEGWQYPDTLKDSPLASWDHGLLWHPRVIILVEDQYGTQQLIAQMDGDTWLAPSMNRSYYEIHPSKVIRWRFLPAPP